MRGCQKIIAIDRVPSRLEIARSLGATNCIDSSDPEIDLVSEVRRLTGGYGVHVSLDTSGVQSLARQSWDFVRCYGKVLQVGLAKPDDVWSVPMADHMNSGKQIIGCVEGDAIPQRFIPDMIQWYRQGKLPIERIVKIYPVHQFKEALEDMRKGTCIKPVLSWAEPHVGLL